MQILKYIFIGLLIFLTCGCGGKKKQGEFRYFRNYQRTFNDLNDKHLKAVKKEIAIIKTIMREKELKSGAEA